MTHQPIRSTRSIFAILVVLALVSLSACTGGTSSMDETTTSAPTTGSADQDAGPAAAPTGTEIALGDLDEELQTLVTNVSVGYQQAAGIWPGFVPNDHPTVIVRKDAAGAVTDAIAINHPAPAELGTATPIELGWLSLRSLHRIVDPTDETTLDGIESFDFHAELGGVDSFAMIASSTDDFFDPSTKDYVATLLHEMFHRYQDEAFSPMVGQDVEGYAYTAANLELAVLEERALVDAIGATDADTRNVAAARFAAIRQARLAADARVVLDNSQEIFEGTARYLEHRLGDQPGSGYLMDSTNYDRDLVTDFDDAAGIKETFGFGRWYASGAAALRLLDQMGVDDMVARVEAGSSPAEILAAELRVTEANRDELVAAARSAYDPDGQLGSAAAAAADRAVGEEPVFGDEDEDDGGNDGGSDGGSDGDGSDGEVPLTEEELACLADRGVDLDAESIELTDEQLACLT